MNIGHKSCYPLTNERDSCIKYYHRESKAAEWQRLLLCIVAKQDHKSVSHYSPLSPLPLTKRVTTTTPAHRLNRSLAGKKWDV